ncbi:MAG: hypothetical protein K2L41_04005 [Muribaculaceae bacterium]|nr:hypothetical protein [Muribaculaceae bacterium]
MIYCDITLSSADFVAIAGVVVSVILSTWVVTWQSRTRAQRDFFIKEVDCLKTDYSTFIDDIRSSKLSSRQIGAGFKNFSSRIRMLNEVVESEYHISRNNVFKNHGKFQILVTGLQSIEDQYNRESVSLTTDEQTTVMSNFQPLTRSMIDLIVEINKANVYRPWEREDFLNH